jgi:succinate dehydrogenase/fumarate reductase flavoprotein subunit
MNKTADPGTATHPWDEQSDVVIVGYGGAGAAAAISAHDAGARVMVLEAMAEGGGNTRVSMGGFLCPSDRREAFTYISSLYDVCHSQKNETVIRAFIEEAVKNVRWIEGLKEGTRTHIYGHAGYPEVSGAGSMKKYLVKGKGKGMTTFARNLWRVLSYAVEEKRRIPVLNGTRAERLVTDRYGAVIGLVARAGEKQIAVGANRAVILTTGGFEYDRITLQNHVKGFPIYASGNPGNRGDGIRMAQKVGAALWHMNAVSCGLGIKVPDFEAGFQAVIEAPEHILVDRAGRRFINECGMEAHSGLLAVDHYDTQSLKYPRIPCYAIFDETARLRGPISRLTGLGAGGQAYRWSKDNQVEIDKGWIIRGRTPGRLAEKLGMAPEVLEATVLRWNRDIGDGADTEFQRPIRSLKNDRPAYNDFAPAILAAPLESPPFYGLPLYPCLANTQGGPRRNAEARILDPFDQPISRLYSAGELGSMWGAIYQGAGNIAECLAFGRIAGKNAANEAPRI